LLIWQTEAWKKSRKINKTVYSALKLLTAGDKVGKRLFALRAFGITRLTNVLTADIHACVL
jgi:hypothetical protein